MLIETKLAVQLNIKPGIVLSSVKPTAPPTNMLVLSNTVKIWSASSLPEAHNVEFMQDATNSNNIN